MFSTIKAMVGELHGINLRLKELIELQRLAGPADERLEALELSRAMWEAEIEGILLKADGHQKAARSAESRTRTMKKHYEDETYPFGDESEEVQTPVRDSYDPPVQADGLLPMHVDVAEDYKTTALRAKFS